MRCNTRQLRWIKLLNDQYCLCYIELYEAQHSPIEMDKNIECDLKYYD